MTTLTPAQRQELLKRLPQEERNLCESATDEDLIEFVTTFEDISQLDTSIAQRETSIAQRETSIAQRETSIAQRETSIAQRETSIAQHRAKAAQHQARADQHARNAYEIAKRHVGEERARPLLGDHTTMVETRRSKESCCVML